MRLTVSFLTELQIYGAAIRCWRELVCIRLNGRVAQQVGHLAECHKPACSDTGPRRVTYLPTYLPDLATSV
jgi:hypothetical protein